MNKYDYLKKAVRAGACYYKTWLISSFGIVDFPEKPSTINQTIIEAPGIRSDEPPRFPHEKHPYEAFDFNGTLVFFNPEDSVWTPIEGYVKGQPLFRFSDEITLTAGTIKNLDRDVTTWVGNLLVNQCVLVYPFGDLIPFQTGRFSIKSVEAIIAEKLESIPENGEERIPGKIYVDILEKYYYDAAFSLTGWTQLGIPTATPYTLTVDPKIRKRRLELLNEYKDELDNPAIIAKIMGELIQMDKNFQADDPEAGYLQPGKSFDVVRAKAFLMYGIERDFSDPNKIILIDRPLSEGWDLTKLPYMVNATIEGSFYRGAMTALGGEAAKFIQRFFLNTKITIEDCGVKYGIYAVIPKRGYDLYGGSVVIQPGGKEEVITSENYASFIGKRVELRSPAYCRTPHPNFCLKCMGMRYDGKRDAPAALATTIGNRLMYIFMKKMHGTALNTHRWDWKATAH